MLSPRIIVAVISLAIWQAVGQSACSSNWKLVDEEEVAISIVPKFELTVSNLVWKTTKIKWLSSDISEFSLSGSRIGQPNVMDIREDNKKRENTLTAFRPSFRGNATMTLSVIPDSLAKEAWIRFDIHAESSSKSIIKWAVDKATTQKIRFIVFNATRRLQGTTSSSPVCLDKLQAGTTYHICGAPEEAQKHWKCDSFTTPTGDRESASDNLFRLHASVEGVSDSWLQISWPPPNLRPQASPPIGYVVLVQDVSNRCLKEVSTLMPPWVTKDESYLMKDLADTQLRGGHRTCHHGTQPTVGHLDAFWPDASGLRKETWSLGWNTASVDEQGPIGIFAWTMKGLAKNSLYNVTITPGFSGIRVRGISFVARTTRAKFADFTPLSDSVSVTNLRYSTDSYSYDVSAVGAFTVDACSQLVSSVNGAVSRQCRQGELTTPIGGLKPGGVYRVKLNYGKDVIRKVVQLPHTKAERRMEKVDVTAVSQSVAIITLKHMNFTEYTRTSTHPVAYIIRICSSNATDRCRLGPLYRGVFDSYSLYTGRSFFRISEDKSSGVLHARLPPTNHSLLYMHLLAYFHGSEEIPLQITAFETKVRSPSSGVCKSWCVWPAGDFANTGPREEFEWEFFSYSSFKKKCTSSCSKMAGAINGETQCALSGNRNDSCSVPVCTKHPLLGCVVDVSTQKSTTWIQINWRSPLGAKGDSLPTYLLLVRGVRDSRCQAYMRGPQLGILSETLETVIQSCTEGQFSGPWETENALNVSGLWQNDEYTFWVIGVTSDGAIGSVLRKAIKTKKAGPCRPHSQYIERQGDRLKISWKFDNSTSCAPAETAVVFINESRHDVPIKGGATNVELIYTFEHCRPYHVAALVANDVGNASVSDDGRKDLLIEHPDIGSIHPKISRGSSDGGFSRITINSNVASPYCTFQYTLRWGALGASESCKVFQTNDLEVPEVVDGLIYNLTVRMEYPGLLTGCKNDVSYGVSRWSKPMTLRTPSASSPISASNVTVATALINDTSLTEGVCPMPSSFDSANAYSVADSIGGNNTLVCLALGWGISPLQSVGFLGYLVQIITDGDAACRLLWLPCEDCSVGFSPPNALPEVQMEMDRITATCLGMPWRQLAHVEPRTAPVSKWHRNYALSLQTSTAASEAKEANGTIAVFAVKMGLLQPLFSQHWNTDAKPISWSATSAAGSTIGVIVLLAIFAIVIAIVVRYRHRRVVIQDPYMKTFDDDKVADVAEDKRFLPMKLPNIVSKMPSAPLISTFVETVQRYENGGYANLRDEFKSLQKRAAIQQEEKALTSETGHQPQNCLRNRYRNILPYDQNRFKLANACLLTDDPNSIDVETPQQELSMKALTDYVNASVLPSNAPHLSPAKFAKCPSFYVAAQAPRECSLGLFWQLIWDSNVRIVIMLTRSFESGKEKCRPYWPLKTEHDEDDDGGQLFTQRFGHFSVTLQTSQMGIAYVRRLLVVRDESATHHNVRRIVQLQMTHWQDFTVPRKDDFCRFLNQYRDDLDSLGPSNTVPVLVHCSAGVGRTGTFIAIDMLTRHVEHALESSGQKTPQKTAQLIVDDEPLYANLTGTEMTKFPLQNRSADEIDIFKTVLWLRSQRRLLVQQEMTRPMKFDAINFQAVEMMNQVSGLKYA